MPDVDTETPKKKGTEKSKKNQKSTKKQARRQGINKSLSLAQATAEDIFEIIGYVTPDVHHAKGRGRRRVQKQKKTRRNSSDDENDDENKAIRKSPRLNKFRTILHL